MLPAAIRHVPPAPTGGPSCSENLAAADVALTAEDCARIDAIVPDGACGSRYPAAYLPKWE